MSDSRAYPTPSSTPHLRLLDEHRGHEWNQDLIVLCADCHKLFHDNRELVK